MKEFKIETTSLPALRFNFDELKAWALGITEQYQGLVVGDDDVQAIKSEMAGLNKMKKALDDSRKEAVRHVSEPIREFELQIKEVCGIFTDTYDFLGAQVKAHEEREREGKRHAVKFMIDAAKDEHGVDITIEINPSWLNKTATKKNIRAEIDSIILAHIKAEREAAQLEQARMERAMVVENKVKERAQIHGFDIPISRFVRLNDLAVPLSDAIDEIVETFSREQGRRDTQSNAAQAAPVMPTPPRPPAPPKPKEETARVTMQVEYPKSMERDVEATLRGLQSRGVIIKIIESNAAHAA